MRIATRALLAAALTTLASVASAADWRAKVDPWVLRNADEHRSIEFLVMLDEQADLTAAARLPSKVERTAWVHERVARTAAHTQAPVLRVIEKAGASYRTFRVANAILVEGDLTLVAALAARADVRHVHANPRVALRTPLVGPDRAGVAAIEWNIEQTEAPAQYWTNGFTGQGIVVASQDTGVQWTHPALRRHYRGVGPGGNVRHDYNWHDAIHSGGGVCGPDTQAPCDDEDHGTLTMGVVVGDDGQGNQIGMAPGAKWIACRNMEEGVGTPASYLECFDFFLAPTDLGGQNPNPARAPDVINNSWICTPEEGCEDPDLLRTAVETVRAAGIFVVASAGNSGNACGSVEAPPAIYDAAISVGAVNMFGEVEGFSSRGPVIVDGSWRLKPEVVAPGHNVRSSLRGGGYLTANGTSMAGPHVTGLAALMMSADACFIGNHDAIESWIVHHAISPFPSSEQCGPFLGSNTPNTTYGYGILRAALPGPGEACDLPIAGNVTGLSAGTVRCIDRTSGEDATSPLVSTSFDCGAAGLGAAPGDNLTLTIRSPAFAGTFTGAVTGMSPARVTCRNVTSGQSVVVPVVPGRRSWNCSNAGFVATQGQVVQMTVTGRAD